MVKLLLKVRTLGFWLRLRNLGGGSPLFLRTCVGEARGGGGGGGSSLSLFLFFGCIFSEESWKLRLRLEWVAG